MLVAVWAITFILIVSAGVYAGKAIGKSSQWNGSDRSMGVFAVGAMLGAWQIGGMSIVGAAQNGYTLGIAGCWYSIAGGVYILVMGLLAKYLRKNMKASSLPIFLENRYDATVSRIQSYVWLIYGTIYVPIQLKTVSSVIQIVLPQLNVSAAMFVGVTIAAAYTGFAGMKGSSVVGRIVSIATYVLLIIFIATTLPKFGGYGGLIQKLPEGYDKLSAMPTQQILAWSIGGITSAFVNQAAMQPMLSAKDDSTALKGCVLGYIIAAPIAILTAMIGMMAKATEGADLGDGARAYAWAIREYSSPVYAGIVFAVTTMIIAATMATMMMATGTVLSNIYARQINPGASDEKVLKVSRVGTIVIAYVSLAIGFIIPSASITNMFMTLNMIVMTPFAYAVLAGMFSKKTSSKSAMASILVAVAVALIWNFSGMNSKISVFYPTIVANVVTGLICDSIWPNKKEIAV